MKVLPQNLSVTEGLLKHLEELYPNTLPLDEINIEKLRYLQGQQSVLRQLRAMYEELTQEN